jgi:hypothetical protein
MDSQQEIRELESKNAELQSSVSHKASGASTALTVPILPPPPNSAGSTSAGYLRRHAGGGSGGATPLKGLRKGKMILKGCYERVKVMLFVHALCDRFEESQ